LISIGEKLARSKGVAPGFDMMRVCLAVCVVTWHSFGIAKDGIWLENTRFAWFLGYGMLFMFFALSGFLIAASAQRLSLKNFLINRGLRILPALAIEVVLSAFILGLVFTSLTPSAYLSQAETYRYLTNIFGSMNFHLPEVFKNNPVDAVNWSLWTVPYEYVCYGIMSVFIILGTLRRPFLILLIAALVVVVGLSLNLLGIEYRQGEGGLLGKIIYFFFTDRGSRLLVAFMLGIGIYLFRFRIPYNGYIALSAALICIGISAIDPVHNYPLANLLASFPLVYLTAYIGVSNVPTLPLFREGDYSYGIYLYGMPIQQMMVSVFPWVTSPLNQLMLAIPAITMFAAFSWHFIERPILNQRKRFSFIARERGLTNDKPDARILQSAE
jgi:peptidoglycan/LPS O-acetylase OafA/YrhL